MDELLQQPVIGVVPLYYEDIVYDESANDLLERFPPPHTLQIWKSGRYMISVLFDKNGRVAAKYYKRAPDASTIDRIADWLGI